jgi:hypothetical protein
MNNVINLLDLYSKNMNVRFLVCPSGLFHRLFCFGCTVRTNIILV